MRKKKKVKVNFGNIFILLLVVCLGVFGIKSLYKFLNNDKEINTNNTDTGKTKKEDDVIKDKLTQLGYSKEESNTIKSNMSNEEINKIDKKYDYLSEFSKVKYFHIENIERYIDYKNKNSDLSTEEIIMNVNTDLDHEYYTNMREVSDPDDLLVLVNKYHMLPSGIEPKNLVNIEGQRMEKTAAEAMENMVSQMRNDGLYIILQSGYRSEDLQTRIYNRNVNERGRENADKYSARPNSSEHQTGLAMDLSTDGTLEEYFEDTPQFEWLQQNAHKYGFIMRYPKDKVYMTGYEYEPWHYRYVGVEVATIIKNENLIYEEYCVKYKGLY